MEQKDFRNFISDYARNIDYPTLELKYGLNKEECDKLWEDTIKELL